ncbi:MAG: porin family protein [Salinivirgaceae bacterium]|jgi:hypothetical protein|nr:porin family protein [Salinivirgaceae bacterium]
MKKIIAILILGLFSIGEFHGQDLKKMQFQVDFGTTLTIPYENSIETLPGFERNPQTDYGSGFGYFFEILMSYNLNSNYAISTGLNYNYLSLKITDKAGFKENKGDLTTSYLTFPVWITYRLSEKIPLKVSAGPYLSVLIGANEQGTTSLDTDGMQFDSPDPLLLIDPEYKYDTDIKKDYTSIDYGFSIQLDYEIPLSQKLTGVVLSRFNYGLKNVLTNDLANKSLANEWKNYNIMFGLGLKF